MFYVKNELEREGGAGFLWACGHSYRNHVIIELIQIKQMHKCGEANGGNR